MINKVSIAVFLAGILTIFYMMFSSNQINSNYNVKLLADSDLSQTVNKNLNIQYEIDKVEDKEKKINKEVHKEDKKQIKKESRENIEQEIKEDNKEDICLPGMIC